MQAPSAADLIKLGEWGAARGLQIHLQTGGVDSIRPLQSGLPPLNYAIDPPGVVLEFGPVDFVQVNARINASMVASALAELDPQAGDRVLDLFCGLGNFTLPLASRSAAVTGVEGDAGLVAKARANASANGLGHARFFTENLFDPQSFGAWAAERYERVLLDPPRAGAREVVMRMASWRPRRVVYISCHPGSLARDAGILVATQGFKLIAAGVMDMFPHTTHVESIAVFAPRE
jgi:23S rRNA (uracil1939-C5)-methyltransferase